MSADCVQLPVGAVLVTGGVACFPPGCAQCPPLDGYYSGVPCGCSTLPQGVNLAVWIPCSCVNAAHAGGDQCPVFRAVLPGGTSICVFPNFAVGPVPLVEGGTVTCNHIRGGCCNCCDSCDGYDFQPFITTITNGVPHTTTGPTIKCCCNPLRATKHISGHITDYQHALAGGVCNDQLLTDSSWDGTIGPNGGTINWTFTEYECGNPNNSTTTTGSVQYAQNCGLTGTNPFGGLPTPVNGIVRATCHTLTEAGNWDGGPGGHYGTYTAQIIVSPAAGGCGPGCAGRQGIKVASGAGIAGVPTRGCSGCGGGGMKGATL